MKTNVLGLVSSVGLLSAMLGGFASGGCGGVSVSSICQEICACQRCTSNDLADCEQDGHEAEQRAEDAGCGNQFDDFLDCVKANVRCEEDKATFDGCSTEALTLDSCSKGSTPLLDICQAAINKIETCVPGASSGSGGTTAQCTGATACASACINDASCEALNDAFTGQSTPASQSFIDCATSCSDSSSSSSSSAAVGSSSSGGTGGAGGNSSTSGTSGAGGAGGG